MNCPFYGQFLWAQPPSSPAPFLLVGSGGNQCALVTTAHSPCLFTDDKAIDWKTCERMQSIHNV